MFANLNTSELDQLQDEKVEIERERGEVFSEKNKPTDFIFCLGSGSAKVTLIDDKTKRESLVKLVAPSDLLGYRCIFSSDRYVGTASALSPSRACRISKDFIFKMIERSPRFSFELLKRMGHEIASSEYHHHSFCQKSVRERIAEAFLILKDKFGEATSNGWRINTHLTRTELANWIGASRETVVRTLTDFQVEGLIRQVGDDLHVLQFESLRKISGASNFNVKFKGNDLEEL